MEKIGCIRLGDKKQKDTWRKQEALNQETRTKKIHGENRKLQTRRHEIGRYMKKIGRFKLGNKKKEDTWKTQEAWDQKTESRKINGENRKLETIRDRQQDNTLRKQEDIVLFLTIYFLH